MGLVAQPVSVNQASRYIGKYHRHTRKPRFFQFAIGASLEGQLVGVAIVGRPIARHLDDGKTLEVRRLCTNGTRNACSFLYARCVRIAKELGFVSLITYTLQSESGDSLRAVGARVVCKIGKRTKMRQWNNRMNRIEHEVVSSAKLRWELIPSQFLMSQLNVDKGVATILEKSQD